MRLLHATVLALVLVAPGCLSGNNSAGTGSSAASSSLPVPIVATSLRFHDDGISFRYPASWKPMRCRAMVTSFLTDVVVLTTTKPQPAFRISDQLADGPRTVSSRTASTWHGATTGSPA